MTQPFCKQTTCQHATPSRYHPTPKFAAEGKFEGGRFEARMTTYMALQSALEDQLLSHGDDLSGRRDATRRQ